MVEDDLSGTAVGATWDVDLIRKGGELMGKKAITKGASVLLGPTVNMHRSPLGGRGFEYFSEDPVLAGNLSAASVNGIQSTGVAATPKRFVCSDLQDKRMSSNSIPTERALREVYLLPFQITQRDAEPLALMTCFDLVNSTHASENHKLLQRILRDEWGFGGLVMSDWFGVYSSPESIKAGLDLEMPFPSNLRGSQLELALSCGKVLKHHLDARVTGVLKLAKKLLPLHIRENAEEKTTDSPEIAAPLRSISAGSQALLKNEGYILPFKKEKSTAVIGPNAAFSAYCGGGSASLLPYYTVSPLEGIQAVAMNVQYELGAPGWKRLLLLSKVAKLPSGQPGLTMKIFLDPHSKTDPVPLDEISITETAANLFE